MYKLKKPDDLFNMVGLKDSVFVYTFKEWLTHPFTFLVGNLHGLLDWLIHYVTWPIFIISFVPILFFWKQAREKILLYIWWIAPIVALAAFGRVLYPRFVLFMAMPLLVLAASGIGELAFRIRLKVLVAILCGLLLYQNIYTDYFLLTNPKNAPIPKADKGQLIDDWPAGWGVKEVNAYITQQSKTSKVSLYTDGTFGLFPYAFETYQLDNPRVTIRGIWPIPQEIPAGIVKDALDHPTYVVFNQLQDIPKWPIELIAEYAKGNNTVIKMRLYRVNPTLLHK